MNLRLKIVTPLGITLEREVSSVVLPAKDGEIEILPDHQPLVTIIEPGELVAKYGTSQEFFAVDCGFARISGNTVSVLVDESLSIDDADMDAIEEATVRAQKALEEADIVITATGNRDIRDPAEIERLDAKVKYQMAKKLIKMKH